MTYKIIDYSSPDFSKEIFTAAPNCKYEEVLKDGISPKNYHALSIYPEYFKVNGKWLLAKNSRMDTVCVVDDKNGNESLKIKEFRNLKVNDKVVVGRTENCEEGIFLYKDGFSSLEKDMESFEFRSGRSRETAYSKDYDNLYELLKHEKLNNSNVTFVIGTSVVLDLKARSALEELIHKGYINSIFCGTDTAAIDLEYGLYESTIGQETFEKEQNSYINMYKSISTVWEFGSIENLIKSGRVKDGFIKACIENDVNLIIPGTIRDRYPLPETITDVYKAQDKMRANQIKTTTTVMLGSVLYSIATGNMTPSYNEMDGKIRPIYIYTVDIQEFAVNKLSDRGSLTAVSIVTNVQDFIININEALK